MSAAPRPSPAWRLRMLAVTIDMAAVAISWLLALTRFGQGPMTRGRLAFTGLAVIGTVGLLAALGLYRRAVTASRVEEVVRLLRCLAWSGLAAAFAAAVVAVPYGVRQAALATVLSCGLLIVGRGAFRSVLMSRRRRGLNRQPVMIVRADPIGDEWVTLLAQHAELGFDVVAIAGEHPPVPSDSRWIGMPADIGGAARRLGLTGALVVGSGMSASAVRSMTGSLHRADIHVQVASPLPAAVRGRIELQSISHEAVLFVSRRHSGRIQRVLKRAMDIVGSLAGLFLAAPVITVAAALVKLEDGGPAFFSQQRIGLDCEPFYVFKLRTMVTNADKLLMAVVSDSERDGPLFKMDRDPRLTRIGRFLDRSSLNELPQLLNVLRGDMSLVGPRPALPAEHAEFDEELRTRTAVRPGITGLWQVEARDLPSFQAYRRLDLQYVDNWSLTLDVVVMIATFETVIARCFSALRRNHDTEVNEVGSS